MVTPSPTLDINRKKREENIANRQAMIANGIVPDLGVQTPITPISPTTITPAPIVNAPVDQNTGLSKPLEPVAQPVQPAPIVPATPVQAEVKTPEVKPVVASSNPISKASNVPPIDYTQAKGREQDIINNLNTFKAQNMTPEQIMKASDYQNATPEKKALIDPYLKVQVPTASAMYNNIVAKADIPDEQKTSLPYKIANNRYMKANMYSTMTPSQLSSEMTNSKLIQGSQAYEDLKAMNPKLIQDTENLRIVNGSKNNLFTYVNNPDGTTKKVNNLEETFKNDFLDNFAEEIKKMFTVQTPEQIRAIIRTPDVVSAEDKAFEYEGKINEIDKQIEASDAEVEARMAGSGATGNRIALEKSMARDKFNKDRDSMVKEYTRYANKANNLTTQNMTMYTTQQQQQQAQNTAMLPFITDQYKTAQAKAQAEQALQDPAIQIGQTMQEFEKMGITSQGSLASKIAEFNKSGLSLPEYVNNLRKLYMAKPEYQRIQNQEAGKGISYQTIGDSVYRQNADGSLTKTSISAGKTDATPNIQRIGGTTENPVFGYFKDGALVPVDSIVTSANAPTATSAKYLDIPTGTDVGVQCGKFARQLCGLDATPGGNSLEAREKAFSDTTPVAGGMILFNGSGYDKTYGHIASIESVNQDGTLNIVESNLKGDNKVTRRTIPANAEGISGFYNNTPLAKGVSQPTGTQGEYTDQNINDLAYLVALQEKNPTQAAKDMKELGYSARDLANYKAGNVPLTDNQKNASTDVMNAIKDLADPDKYEWNDAVGKFDPKRLIGTQDAEDATIAINNLVAKMTLPNLGVLKGPMSDKDIQFIKEASTKLDTRQSNASFERNLIDAYNLSARRAGMPEIKKLSDLKSGTKSTVGGELDYSKYE